MNHNSPAEIRAELDRLTVEPKKRWGQNFMVNPRTRRKLIDTLEIGEGETVWEIGPGLGALTTELVPRCARLVLFEVDHGLIRHLNDELGNHAHVRIVAGDFLRTWRQARVEHGAPDRIVGNLPYRSASAIVAALLEHDARPLHAVFTVQKELAERIVAPAGSRNYSSFSVLCQCLSQVRSYGELAPGTFYPAPEVTSAVIGLRPGGAARRVRNRDVLFALIRASFQARRKTLRNNLLAGGGFGLSKADLLDAVEDAGVNPGSRAEELAPATFVRLADALVRKGAAVPAQPPFGAPDDSEEEAAGRSAR
ncbi:MAG: 16S rRNA (adenine(1518)-N(6)/adenine(1519)-N(6))-dimethyltransferase RsmA [Spirochaetaceae bacterium]|nr:16S rRNA (adenine(1518)-N(6)/adenine(1519)-N(6))-dimethyltransferase RsmA [Spirochaetaceae bacterium]